MPNYHLCFTSHKEVLFRDEEDMHHAFNSLCSSLYKTDSACYAYANMSDHHHGCYRTKVPTELIRTFRESHTKYFNHKYHRKGSFGEPDAYVQEISGTKHFIAAVTYVVTNAPHHGVSSTPFEYPYSSANDYFQGELGNKQLLEVPLLTYEEIKAVLPRRAEFDPSWKMGRNGVFLSASVLDIGAVEAAYGTAAAFNYYLGRKSTEDWIKEQADENVSSPFTLESVEAPLIKTGGVSLADLLRNEKSRVPTASITDLELCSIIDNQFVPKYRKPSVYLLSQKEKKEIANALYKNYCYNSDQIKRCLVL